MSDKKPSLLDLSRRSYLALLGATGSGAAALGSVDSTDSNDKLAAGGFESNLTEFSNRDQYATGPDGLFDPSQLQENEIYWKTESGELGVKGPDGPERPPLDVSAVSAKNINNKICVSNYPGGDLGEQINNAVASLGDREDVYLYAEPGVHTISTVVDLTDFRGATFDFRGSYILLSTGGQPSIDLTDSWDWHFYFERMVGDPDNPPSSGLLIGATDDFAQTGTEDSRAGGHERKWLKGGAMWGSFQYAPVWRASRERFRFGGDYTNDASQGYAYVQTKNNRARVNGSVVSETSPFKGTLTAISNKKTWAHRASFFSIKNTGDGVVYLEGDIGFATFRDVEVVGKKDEALWKFDCSQNDIQKVRIKNSQWRTDDLAGTDSASKGILIDDEGNGNKVTGLHIEDTRAILSEDGSSPAAMETQGSAFVKYLTIDGETNLKNSATGAANLGSPSWVTVKGMDFNQPTVNQRFVVSNSIITEATTTNSATIRNDGDWQNVEFTNSGANHALSGEASNLVVDRITASASGSSYDAIHLADQTTGAKSWLHGIRVTGSDRYGIWLDQLRESVVSGCNVEGYGTNVTEDDLFLRNGLRVVITGNYFNGDVTIGSGSTETILNGNFIRGVLTDNGTRTVIDGRGTNAGDPNSTGEWNGSEAFARKMGVTVEDTTNSNVYWPKADGTWSQLGT